MNKTLIALLSFAVPAMAGTSGKEVVAEPAPEPTLYEWFAGGSIGYLADFEEPMYHLHFGQDTDYQFGGWDFAWFLEVGYTDKEASRTFSLPRIVTGAAALTTSVTIDAEMSIMPITINGKFEREFAEDWNVYAGAGIGYSEVDFEISSGSLSVSDDDWVFTAQVFTGVQYDITADWEVYAGARWIYWDDADIGASTLEMEDDLLAELGFRYNF